jgi:hypothetical protein
MPTSRRCCSRAASRRSTRPSEIARADDPEGRRAAVLPAALEISSHGGLSRPVVPKMWVGRNVPIAEFERPRQGRWPCFARAVRQPPEPALAADELGGRVVTAVGGQEQGKSRPRAISPCRLAHPRIVAPGDLSVRPSRWMSRLSATLRGREGARSRSLGASFSVAGLLPDALAERRRFRSRVDQAGWVQPAGDLRGRLRTSPPTGRGGPAARACPAQTRPERAVNGSVGALPHRRSLLGRSLDSMPAR